jgi:putative DNA primase/helicase
VWPASTPRRVARASPSQREGHRPQEEDASTPSASRTCSPQAASDARVAVDYAELDAHPWELNTPGGIVDLRTGQLAPDPARLHTRLTCCTPDPAADRGAWLAFLATTFGGDQELIDYLQRLVGYSAVGSRRRPRPALLLRPGRNGKGTFLETCVKVLGDYATTAPAGFLMAKPYQGHETEIARLSGARMVVCSEVNDGDRFDEARVKVLTGGDTLTARFMQQDHFTFTPTHQLWAMGNHQPHVAGRRPSVLAPAPADPVRHEVPPSRHRRPAGHPRRRARPRGARLDRRGRRRLRPRRPTDPRQRPRRHRRATPATRTP